MSRRRSSAEKPTDTGSDTPVEPVFVAVGRIRRPHGTAGEVKVVVITDFPERLKPGKSVFIGPEYKPHTISSIRLHNSPTVIMAFKELSNIEDVEWMRNNYLMVRTDSLPELPEGEYYFHHLIGLQVYDEGGERLGILSDILETGANDVYIVRSDDGVELLLPAIDSVIVNVDLSEKRMIVRKPVYL